MKLIKPSFEIIEQGYELSDIHKHIELCGRTCYKSEDKITDDSAKPFVDRMIDSKHLAMLEHGTIYLAMPMDTLFPIDLNDWYFYVKNKYSSAGLTCEVEGEQRVAVTTNLRVLIENQRLEDLKYLCEPTPEHERRVTVKFTCNRQVSHEFVRHRVFSFAQESTRYCNYTLGKFGGELTFIIPCWLDMPELQTENTRELLEQMAASKDIGVFLSQCHRTQDEYFRLINNHGWKPQQAATVLPNALKTELIMTGFISDWKHFFDLRALGTTGAPHPQAKELAEPLMKEFIKRGYIKE